MELVAHLGMVVLLGYLVWLTHRVLAQTVPTSVPLREPVETPERPVTYPAWSCLLENADGEHINVERVVHQAEPPVQIAYGGKTYHRYAVTQTGLRYRELRTPFVKVSA